MSIYPVELAILLVTAVHAPAVLVALLPCRKALAVELHALGVAAVADLLLSLLPLQHPFI